MNRCKKWLGAILVIMLLFTMACSTGGSPDGTASQKEDPPESVKTFTIGISLLYRQDEYYKDLVNIHKHS